MKTALDTIAEYPPLVFNPALGKHVLLRWHAHNEDHIIINADAAEALSTWGVVLDKHPDAEIRDYIEAVLVHCPLAVAEAWAKERYAEELDDFKRWIQNLVSDAWESTGKIQEGFKVCPHRDNSMARYSCKKCDSSRIIPTISLEDMFEVPAVRTAFRTPVVSPVRFKRPDQPQPTKTEASTEPLPFPDLPLQVALLGAEHHSAGVVLKTVDEWESCYKRLPVLFFFQGATLAAPKAFTDLMAAKAKEIAEKKARLDARYNEERREYFRANATKLAEVMGAYKGVDRTRLQPQ